MERDVAGSDAEARTALRTGRTWHDLPAHPPVGDAPDVTWRAPTAPADALADPPPDGRRRLLVALVVVGLVIVGAALAGFALSGDDGGAVAGEFGDRNPEALPEPDESSTVPDEPTADDPPSADDAPTAPDASGSAPSFPQPSPEPSAPGSQTAPGSDDEIGGTAPDPGPSDGSSGEPAVPPLELPTITLTDLPPGYRQTSSFQSVESAGSELTVVAGRDLVGPDGEVRVTARRPGTDELSGDPAELADRNGYETVADGRRQFTWRQDDMTVTVDAPDDVDDETFEQLVGSVEVTR